ncbi:MAG: VCBS repeat-containing protein [Myxococcota bacterium]|nr:VCBS repeat-containing protein [Myxococcota bacterium]
MTRWGASIVCVALCSLGCGGGSRSLRLEDWVRVGVDPRAEAEAIERALTDAGWSLATRREAPDFVALAFTRDEQRAIRLVTRRGVVLALDSHELDGLRIRHGLVSLPEPPREDLDGDGRPDLLIAREEADAPRCLAVVRVDEEGRAASLPIAGDALATGACASELVDVDGDGELEAVVALRWPELAMEGEVPAVEAPLVLSSEGWRPDGLPATHRDAELAPRLAALERARAELDVPQAARLGVELAALAHLAGAAMSAQVERFDAALAGMVLSEAEAARAAEIRGAIAAGWRAPDAACATPSGSCDGQEEQEGRAR